MILVTNDDGIGSPGLRALVAALKGMGEVAVLAPDHNWSAAGLTKTMHKPLRVNPTVLPGASVAYVTNGAPSDCVALAVLGFLPQPPHLVVSGINLGANAATDIFYSGTVAAALEGLIAGLPSLAFSLDTYEEGADFSYAAKFAAHLVKRVEEGDFSSPLLLNVNVPALPPEKIAGIEITRLGRRFYQDSLVERQDPRGRKYYWLGGEKPAGAIEEGTDIWALSERCISITPLQLDMTDHSLISELKKWELRWISGKS